ncbi:pyruvate kinase [Lentibacillus sp. L22]|uniref:pyruvate kinase n=1 Tax=Lentibacillus TaxID=175304 RepID=UPI0022B0DA2A|nr:pyruvate kinase [Lentibacillus daqui]
MNPTAKKLLQLYEQILLKQSSVSNYPTPHQRFSAKNLIAFIELQNNVEPFMLDYLRANGLVLTYTDHIREGLHKTCMNLGIGAKLRPAPMNQYHEAIKRKNSILNTRQSDTPEVMVTLDLNTPEESIKDFLSRGMTIARINCAYGTWEEWQRLVQSIRWMEEQLQANGTTIPPCKIYMDLSGPKIRVGKIQRTTYPLKIKVNKDRYGAPLNVKTGILVTREDFKDLKQNGFDFIIPLIVKENSPLFLVGDTLQFRDARMKKRKFTVSGIHPNGYIVTISKTCYIGEGTALCHAPSHNVYHIGKLASSPVDIFVKNGDRLKIHLSNYMEGQAATINNPAEISITLPDAFANVKVGESIYIDDGKIHGIIEHVDVNFIIAKVIYPDTPKKIKEDKGINLPETAMKLPAFTSKDMYDLQFIHKYADLLGASFVHTADDLAYLRLMIPKNKIANLTIVAKIETRDAVNNFSKILLEGLHFPKFAVMIARGDLANEVGFEKLSIIQHEMLAMCQAAHVPVILATQVLDTLAKKGVPARSELADVMFGSSFDCIMLNKGPYAGKAVDFLKETLQLIVKTHRYNYKFVRRSKRRE